MSEAKKLLSMKFFFTFLKCFFLSLLFSLAACSSESGELDIYNKTDVKTTKTWNQETETFIHDGIVREYVLYIPSDYDEAITYPLMFNFHGFGGEAVQYISYADMRSLADRENFILVYPQGTLSSGSPHWNPSLPSSNNKSDANDLDFVESLIRELSSHYNIDLERVYACGFSNGGMMAYGLAQHKSDLIAGIASVSGVMLESDVNPTHPMPVFIIHGTSDAVLPYNGNGYYNSIQSTIDFWKDFNNINTDAEKNNETINGITIEHYLFDSGDQGVSVEHYKVTGGDHVWFDIQYQGNDIATLIWDFLSKFDINGLID